MAAAAHRVDDLAAGHLACLAVPFPACSADGQLDGQAAGAAFLDWQCGRAAFYLPFGKTPDQQSQLSLAFLPHHSVPEPLQWRDLGLKLVAVVCHLTDLDLRVALAHCLCELLLMMPCLWSYLEQMGLQHH